MHRAFRSKLVWLGFAATLPAIFIWSSLDSEPRWEGKSLSEWCEQTTTKDDQLSDEGAMRAVRAIGTNAIPWLLKDLKAKSHAWHKRANQLLEQQKFIEFRFPNTERRWQRGSWGIFALGASAKSAIPELETIIENPRVPWALAGIGPPAIPAMCRALTNGNQNVEVTMAVCIATAASMPFVDLPYSPLGPDDLEILLPLMQQQANSTNTTVKIVTAYALNILKTNGVLEGKLAVYKAN